MPRIKFIGNYDPLAEGKFLLEILSQLKDFGAGRIVTKTEWLNRWPSQPSYLRIRKVAADMDRWLWRGKVYADWTYRGKPLGTYLFAKELDRSDWKLIHKHDEDNFCRCASPFTVRRVPTEIPLPPLQRYIEQQKSGGRTAPPMLPFAEHVDDEYEMLKGHTKADPQLNPSPTGSVYDVDPAIYLDLYGKVLPTKVEKWGDE